MTEWKTELRLDLMTAERLGFDLVVMMDWCLVVMMAKMMDQGSGAQSGSVKDSLMVHD